MPEYKIGDIRNGYKVVPKEERKTILLLSDDLRMTSGVGNVSKDFVLGTCHIFNWVQIGGAINHPEAGMNVDISEDTAKRTGISDAVVKVHPSSGYGNQPMVRALMDHYKPDALMIYTDPRFWEWLFQMEHEIRQTTPILYYNIWDSLPYPMWNQKYYDSVDALFNISKQTTNLVKQVRSEYEPWQVTYLPHGVNHDEFYPIPDDYEQKDKFESFKKQGTMDKEKDFVVFYNARNIRRKLPADIIMSYKAFCDTLTKEQANKCMLMMHCTPVDENGTDLPQIVKNICPEYDVMFSANKLEREQLNWLYNLADVSILISSNEGFGLMGAESIMAGTPIIINVSGGMQDYCGFKKENGEYLTVDDYTMEWGSNHDGRYKDCGEWAFPVFPTSRSLQGSLATPYISDDRPDFQDVAIQLKNAWKERGSKLKKRGKLGREWAIKNNFTVEAMSRLFMEQINESLEKFKPRTRIMLDNATKWSKKVPKWNGLTVTKEI